MKYPLLLALLLTTISFIPTPTLAQRDKKVEFYCSRTQDSDKKPITQATIHGVKRDDIAVIVWSNQGKMTARERCERVSTKFQAAWDRGDFNYFGSGVDKNGVGLICALKDKGQNCDGKNVLFTLKNGQESRGIIDRLLGILKANNVGIPLYQSSGEFPSIDMQDLIKVISTPQKVGE
jgi:Circadian oscillating protein COP23